MGRKPTPTNIKKAMGNPGKRPLNDREPQPDNTMPRCPSHLSKDGKSEWRRVAKRLHEAGLLTYVDMGALAMYCQAYGRWVQAERALADDDLVVTTTHGNVIKNPMLNIADKAHEQVLKTAREFGMTPTARTSLKVGTGDSKPWSINDALNEMTQREGAFFAGAQRGDK